MADLATDVLVVGSYRAAIGWGRGRTPSAALVPLTPVGDEPGGRGT